MSRIFNLLQYEFNPKTGDDLHFNEKNLIYGVNHKTIKRWAYIRHDKDTYAASDEEKNSLHKNGTTKPAHWHCIIECGSSTDVSTIAKWFGVPANNIAFPKGAGAFLDCVEYLTHEDDKQQENGKHKYEDEEIKANFNFREILDARAEHRLKNGSGRSVRDQMRYDVLYNGKTLNECIEDNRFNYMNDIEKLKKYRMEYISKMNPPKNRLNYYVCGSGGIGKGLMCRAIARNMFPNIERDEDIFFEVGAKNAAFEGYDGQPVIIWNDRRAIDLLQELNGRGNVFNVFDTHPTKQKQNIKYGSINLCNVINIVNSIQPYKEFLDGLAGDYIDKSGEMHKSEDKSQSYRRFPFIIPIHEDDFDLLINYGFLGEGSYLEYLQYNHIVGNMKKIAVKLLDNEKMVREIEAKTVLPITQNSQKVLNHFNSKPEESEEDIRKIFENYGTHSSDNICIVKAG